ncbi:Metallo-dependent phosphatase-like protein [Bisporella sp. PMI_857]|nr:Metallo-dependent phosphatase-like protein [Bisporella sp. PMI_857]
MRPLGALLAICLLRHSYAKPIRSTNSDLQAPLVGLTASHPHSSQQLHGRFLHITDLHPDQFYKVHASTEEEDACHRGSGTSGIYGAETSDCDTPFALINATFKWIAENIKDEIDFVIWTGDSARHDSDEKIPRNAEQVLSTNKWIASKFLEVFSEPKDPNKALAIPVIPTFGNNDILPHNILLAGPNKWLKEYSSIWGKFIPEEQRHGFERGGWYYVEVIPRKLAVFSLNTLYFFDNNAAVDGCALKSEPGYEHMEWLRIQLQIMRERGMKAILIGHVPPARTNSKKLWDESCWQKYTLWLQQYRDIVVGGLYGHMNIDHFIFQDTKEVNIAMSNGYSVAENYARTTMDDELSVASANDYLEELRENWSELPNPSVLEVDHDSKHFSGEKKNKNKKGKKDKDKEGRKKKKALKNMGGAWGERFQLSHIGPSVVPNFFPTLRIIEYNITGLDRSAVWANPYSWQKVVQEVDSKADDGDMDASFDGEESIDANGEKNKEKNKEKKGKKHKKSKKPKKPSDPDLIIPSPPVKGTPPGPAYSPQPFTFVGYTQYFANLTHINNDYMAHLALKNNTDLAGDLDSQKWHEGKHKGKKPEKSTPDPNPFRYEVEYDTFTDKIYKLKDMTVMSYIKLAHRIGQYKPQKGDRIDDMSDFNSDAAYSVDEDDELVEEDLYHRDEDNHPDLHGKNVKKRHRKHKKRHHEQNEKNKVWLRFINRAFVGTLEKDGLESFDREVGGDEMLNSQTMDSYAERKVRLDTHDGEL